MSRPAELINQSAPPVAPPAAPADDLSINDEISRYNQAVEADADDLQIPQPKEALAATPAPVPDADPAGDEAAEDDADPSGGEEEAPAEAEGSAEVSEITFDPATETPESYAEKKAAIFARFEEIPPEIQALVDYSEKAAADAQAALAELDAFGNKEHAVKVLSAFDQIFETEVTDDGRVKANLKPVNEMLRTEYPNEYFPLANAIFESDSLNAPGMSVFEEILLERYGKEKVGAVANFLAADLPLPSIPKELELPDGIPEAAKEAFFKLPEVKRYEIQELQASLAQLEEDLKAEPANSYYREEMEKNIGNTRARLNAELYAIEQIQRGLDSDRQQAAIEKRQQAEAVERFTNELFTEYNEELFGLRNTFVENLAPNLTFAEGPMQKSHARNILTRIENALRFDPSDKALADMNAKELTEEGIKFDFVKGRALLERHFKAVEHVKILKAQGASKPAIDKAIAAKDKVMLDIKKEHSELIGQISTKYVKSSGKALEQQIETIKGKKQFARAIVRGNAHTGRRPVTPISKEITDYNRRVAARDGDELFDAYQ